MAPSDSSRTHPIRWIAERRAVVEHRVDAIERRLAEVRSARSEWTDEEHDPEGFTLTSEWSQAEGRRAEHQTELRALDLAESRVWEGSFGLCEVCGEPIPLEQLQLRPARTSCVACAI